MDRLHGQHQCQSCHMYPSMGWLYVCREDSLHRGLVADPSETWFETQARRKSEDELRARSAARSLDATPREDSANPPSTKKIAALTVELEIMGFSKSIIKQAEDGLYTSAQLDLLKRQKTLARRIIDLQLDSERAKVRDNCAHEDPARPLLGAAKAYSIDQAVSSKSQSFPNSLHAADGKTSSRTDTASPSSCNLKCCHACRSFYQDRIYMSFEAVFSNEIPPLSLEQARYLPIRDANKLKGLLIENPPERKPSTVVPPERSSVTESETASQASDRSTFRRFAHKAKSLYIRHHRSASPERPENKKPKDAEVAQTHKTVSHTEAESPPKEDKAVLGPDEPKDAVVAANSLIKCLRHTKDYGKSILHRRSVRESLDDTSERRTSMDSARPKIDMEEAKVEMKEDAGLELTEEAVENHTLT